MTALTTSPAGCTPYLNVIQRRMLASFGAERINRLPNNQAAAYLAEHDLIDVYWINNDGTVMAKLLSAGREALKMMEAA